jgi:glucose-6-phosphate 1-epimerase
MSLIQELNQRFGSSEQLVFTLSRNDTPIAQINTPLCRAQVALQGAQVCSWVPAGEQPVIWLSDKAVFAPAKSLRGGVPVCWPWFGAHSTHKEFPAHGFARTVDWSLRETQVLADGMVTLLFELENNASIDAMWPADCRLTLHMKFGHSLELELTTENTGQQPAVISEALHTYFAVGDVRQVQVSGLENTDYLDKVDDFALKHQTEAIRINSEVDRVYIDTEAECVIEDAHWQRRIHIQKRGSRSTVVWNPWQEKADAMGDMGVQGYLSMLCVESANAMQNAVTIPAGQSHSLWVKYQVVK